MRFHFFQQTTKFSSNIFFASYYNTLSAKLLQKTFDGLFKTKFRAVSFQALYFKKGLLNIYERTRITRII